MTDVFISYKSDDRARVKPLVDALIANGLSVWWDLSIEAGASWRQTIQTRLDAAACVIVIWSVNSVGPEGYFVHDEASHARRRGTYLPLAIDNVDPPLGFGQEQVLKLTNWRGNVRDPRFLDVLAAAQAVVAAKGRPPPEARARAIRRPAPRWLFAGAALAILLAAGGLAIAIGPARLCSAAHLNCPGGTHTATAAPRNSIAVLPFTNLSGDPSQDYFADGLSEELIAALSRLQQLRVVARSSSFTFKGSKEGAIAIGAKLSAAYLLDGAVRRDGARVRVSAQLADTRTGYEQWSETYDRDMRDIFAVQSGIAQAVAAALKVRLATGDIAALSDGGTTDAKAYDAFLRGRALLRTGGGESDYRSALAYYDAAIQADPTFAKAHAGRAVALMDIASGLTQASEVRGANQAALAAARRAAQLAPDVAEVLVTLADALIVGERDFTGAAPVFAHAVAIGDGHANVLIDYGVFRCQVGDCASAVHAIQRGAALDPLDPLAYQWLGWALIRARRYPEAPAPLRRALELSPDAQSIHALIGDSLLMQGKFGQAKLEYGREPAAWARLTGQAIVLQRLGDPGGARAAMAALIAIQGDTSHYQQAQIRAQWGDIDTAFAELDAAIRTGDPGALFVKADPLMDPLRGDPRFAARLAALGLPPRV